MGQHLRSAMLLLAMTLLCADLLARCDCAPCNAGDRRALLAFKAQLLDPKNALTSWTSSSDCCGWTQILCDGNGRITNLFLSNIFDTPNLPSNYQLKVKNGVRGAGASLGALKELTELSMIKVAFGFAHAIPPEFGSLPKLRTLRLIDCEFNGRIPPTIGNLVQLSELILHNNRFSGPAILDSFGNLKALRTLSLINNAFTTLGSQTITRLNNLELIDLSHNKISGPIPTWLGAVKLSNTLVLSHNPFSGPIPGSLCNIKGLMSLYIANTQVTSIPAEIGNCRELRVLYLVNNKLRGGLPGGLGKLSKLQTLALGSDSVNSNRMTGRLLGGIGDLPLLDFDIQNNQFYGPIPGNYGPFSIVKVPAENTRFQGNNLSGPIPSNLKNVPADRFRPGNPGLCGAPLPAC